MAIQVGGTTVINDSRQLQNIASLDSASSAIISTAAAATDDYYDVTTTSLSPVISGGSSPYVAYQGSISYPAGSYKINLVGTNSPWWSLTTQNRTTTPLGGTQYIGCSATICAKVGSDYFALNNKTGITTSTATEVAISAESHFNSQTTDPVSFIMGSAFTVAVCFGTYQIQRSGAGLQDGVAYTTGAITSFGTLGSYKLVAGSTFGFRITADPIPTLRS